MRIDQPKLEEAIEEAEYSWTKRVYSIFSWGFISSIFQIWINWYDFTLKKIDDENKGFTFINPFRLRFLGKPPRGAAVSPTRRI